MGGLFREQDLEAVRRWLNAVFQPHVEATYLYFRNDHEAKAVLQPRVPTASIPPPPSSEVSEGVRPGSSSRPTGERHQSLRSQTNEPRKGSGRVGGSMVNRPEVVHQSSSKRRGGRSGQVDGRKGDTGEQDLFHIGILLMILKTLEERGHVRFCIPRCCPV